MRAIIYTLAIISQYYFQSTSFFTKTRVLHTQLDSKNVLKISRSFFFQRLQQL